MKTFKEFVSEATFIGKAFALLQRSQLQKKRSQLTALGERVRELSKDATRERDALKKLDKIALSQIYIGSALQVIADISSNLMDASVTAVIDSKDITKAVKDALKSK